MPEELAANERAPRARKWNVQTGTLHRQVWLPVNMRLIKAAPMHDSPDRYQIAGLGITGRIFELCADWSNDKLQSFVNNEADEVAMEAELS